MFVAATAPTWLAGPADRRLREVSTVVKSNARPEDYAAVLSVDVVALQALTADLQRYINVCNAPILRLSPEIISLIFDLHAVMHGKLMDTLQLGHVCQQFRSVVLGMRSLWGEAVCVVKLAARQEVLSRAGGAGLVLHFDQHRRRSNGSDVVEFMRANISRACSLTCRAYGVNGLPWSPRDLCALDLQRLEHLDLELIRDPWQSADLHEMGSLRAPGLKHVHLRNIFIPFPPRNLVTLSLERHQKAPELKSVSFEDFSLLLRQCTELKDLRLSYALPCLGPSSKLSPDAGATRMIELPKLWGLYLQDTLDKVVALHSRLSMRAIVNMVIECDTDGRLFDAMLDGPRGPSFVDYRRLELTSSLATHFPNPPFTALEIGPSHCGGGAGGRCILVDACSPIPFAEWDNTFEAKDDLELPALELDFGRCEWDDDVSYIHHVERLTPFLINVRDAFMIAQWRDMKGEDVRRLCAAMPRLIKLCLSMAQQSSLAALIVPSDSELQAGSVSIPLPKLEHLLIYEFILHQEQPPNITDFVPPKEWTATKKDMLDVVASRARAGIPLQSLTIKSASGFDDDSAADFATKLREHVPVVNISAKPERRSATQWLDSDYDMSDSMDDSQSAGSDHDGLDDVE